MNITKVLEQRYSTKVFDPTRSIDQETMKQVMSLLQNAPSSTNIQPWHFVIASSKEGKRRVAKATQGLYHFNTQKVLDASAVVLFASRVTAEPEYMNHLIEKEDKDCRFTTLELKAQTYGGRGIFADLHKYEFKDQQHWLEKQLYLNGGCFLLGVAALGLDALPMEGCDTKILNEEFGLIEKGFTASFLVAIGYHSELDYNFKLPKSRLSQQEIIEMV